MAIDLTISLPVYKRIENDMRDRLVRGEWAAGRRIPGRRDLARQYGVEVNTLQRAILALVDEGLLSTEPSRGTFAAPGAILPAEGSGIAHAASSLDRQDAPLCIGVALGDAYWHDVGADYSDQDEYHSRIVRGIRQALAPYELRHSITFIENWDYETLSSVPRNHVAGILVVTPDVDRRGEIDQLWRSGTPVVVANSSWPGMSAAAVDCDNAQGMQRAVQELVALGHRDIACGIASMRSSNHRDRIRAFRKAMVSHGLSVPDNYAMEHWNPTTEQGIEWMRALLSCPNRPTAVIALGYVVALNLLPVARDLGLEIPRDLSLITFDDIRGIPVQPQLWTIATPFEDVGCLATKTLIKLCLGGRLEPTKVVVGMPSIERELISPPATREISVCSTTLDNTTELGDRTLASSRA